MVSSYYYSTKKGTYLIAKKNVVFNYKISDSDTISFDGKYHTLDNSSNN